MKKFILTGLATASLMSFSAFSTTNVSAEEKTNVQNESIIVQGDEEKGNVIPNIELYTAGWQHIYSVYVPIEKGQTVNMGLENHKNGKPGRIYSGGGNLKVSVTATKYGKTPTVKYKLMEYDPSNADEVIGTRTVNGSDTHTFDVRKYVDGDNKKAEIYIKFYDANMQCGIDVDIWD
ncbi:hypothetical protein M3603_08390 [Rummeliibacillus stabekisii]|uniref:hypothetical protein n=1 Tax=Rummeliibacillus stabekisii TaxID=241244 RepID=UPI00203CE90B|nr:hypothetical protein [Rummeliibacillus stabekisii]MCM3316695.1 hypothetical protein [Rummeliibacillus stabekisii]